MAFPTETETSEVLSALGSSDGLSLPQIQGLVNVRHKRIESMMKILEVEGAVYRTGSRWFRSATPWVYPAERIDRVTAHRRAEQGAMVEYVATDGCLMELLRTELDDPGTAPCGRCANCTGALLPTETNRALVERALAHIRRTAITISPRAVLPCGLRGELDLRSHNIEPGRSLTRWDDPGLAELVQRGESTDHPFSDELVDATVAMVRAWHPDPAPSWVTGVPSSSGLVRDLAGRVADRLDLPYLEAIHRTQQRPPQKTQQNSCRQARNVLGAFAIDRVKPDPVLLIDDTVDSRWTLTVLGSLLRSAGSGPVYPVVLADTSGSDA